MKSLTIVLLIALLILNTVSFFLMGYDKQCAREQRRRIPERTLFLSAAFFGAFGGTLGMFAFRHKTKHWYFRIFFPLLMLLQAGIIGYLWSRGVF